MKASEQACGANISLTHYLLREFHNYCPLLPDCGGPRVPEYNK